MPFEKSNEPCPKCGRTYIISESSCSNCGLIFAKWEQKQQGAFLPGAQKLDQVWQEVLTHWTNEAIHQKFMDSCQREQNLPFASLRYKKVLEADPHSEIALRMQKKIQEMVMSSFLSATALAADQPSQSKAMLIVTVVTASMLIVGLNLPGQYISTGLPLLAVAIFAFFAIQWLKRSLNG